MGSALGTMRVRGWVGVRVVSVALLWGMWVAQAWGWQAAGATGGVASTLPDAPGVARSASVTGTVTDTDDAGIASARVTLEEADTKASRTAVPDGSGRFSFADVEA